MNTFQAQSNYTRLRPIFHDSREYGAVANELFAGHHNIGKSICAYTNIHSSGRRENCFVVGPGEANDSAKCQK